MDNHGWVRIVEAMVGILLIAGFLIVIINNGNAGDTGISEKVYSSENTILREIQLNNTFRTYILGIGTTSVEFENFDVTLKNHITSRIPNYLNCTGKICDFATDSTCTIESSENNLYARSVMIATNENTYSPKLLKLFCWEV